MKMMSLVIFTLLLQHAVEGYNLFMCETDLVNKAKIMCHHPYEIQIEYANYGRTNNYRCRDVELDFLNDEPQECCVRDRKRYFHFFSKACNGKPDCTIYKLKRYDEPCAKLDKYLEIRWSCKVQYFKPTLALMGYILLAIALSCVFMCFFNGCMSQRSKSKANKNEILEQDYSRKAHVDKVVKDEPKEMDEWDKRLNFRAQAGLQ